MVSIYTEFNLATRYGNRSFYNLTLSEMFGLTKLVSGQYVGLQASGVLESCLVGITELHEASYSLLHLAAPWVGAPP
jgi:hypothetical protein